MGRSGNIRDGQPKAVGSTILVKLTEKLVESALRTLGFHRNVLEGGLQIMPVCTGMSIALALMAVQSPHKRVIWLRIDQKSCFKAILAANLEPIIVEGKYDGEEIVTDLEAISKVIEENEGNIHSIVSCVTCFAPRAPDSIVQISLIAKKYSIAHVVNAAYGGASERACNMINAAVDSGGRIDALIMSLDKNFMVPVGGAIIFGPNPELIERIGKRYAGRAGISHVIDIFITLLGMGRKGILKMKADRMKCFEYFKNKLASILDGDSVPVLKLLNTLRNDISLAVQLASEYHLDTSIGSQLFYRNISGIRVIDTRTSKITKIDQFEFRNFGAHLSDAKERIYLNVAAAVGSKETDIEEFLKKFTKITGQQRKDIDIIL